MLRVVREALLGFSRSKTMSFFAVLATGFSLLVLGMFWLALLNINALIRYFEDKVEVVVYLRDGADQGEVGMALENLSALEGVHSVKFVSKEEALDNFRDDLGPDSDLLQDLETNPVPASFNITMDPGFRDTLHVERVAERARELSFVEDVDYGREWLRRIDMFKRVVAVVGISAGALLALVAVILIASAIRIAIFSRSREIFIMKIVGATNGYIRRSFLLEGLLKGTLGGLMAAGMVFASTEAFAREVMPIETFAREHYVWTVAAGALMGLVGSWFSLGRYLRRI